MSKGFTYYLEDEKLIDYMKLSVEDKLKWLEEISQLNNLFMTKQDKLIQQKLIGNIDSVQ